ncbi:MAG: diacylglycerol kinase family protein [Candidatus Kerfeldbacteria bacterium]|nr:diacylglycerol kinase family protein [Candidatus Kerfeldbacteria bacterium]
MVTFNPRIFLRSFRYALTGLRYALRHEQSFRVQLGFAAFAVVLMTVLQVSRLEAVALILVMSSVLVLELLNTVLEKFIDVLKPRVHYFVAIMKDLMAAAVLVASIAAVIVGALIFIPRLLSFL